MTGPAVNMHTDLAAILDRARALHAHPPFRGRLSRAVNEGALGPDDVRWIHLAADFIEAVITELEPGALRSAADLPDSPPLFTTRRLFKALESRVERLERPATDPGRDRYLAAIDTALSHLNEVGTIAAGVPAEGIAARVNAARDVLRKAVGQ